MNICFHQFVSAYIFSNECYLKSSILCNQKHDSKRNLNKKQKAHTPFISAPPPESPILPLSFLPNCFFLSSSSAFTVNISSFVLSVSSSSSHDCSVPSYFKFIWSANWLPMWLPGPVFFPFHLILLFFFSFCYYIVSFLSLCFMKLRFLIAYSLIAYSGICSHFEGKLAFLPE